MFPMKPQKLTIIFLSILVLCSFFAKGNVFAQVCSPGSCTSCLAGTCCGDFYECGIYCPPCGQGTGSVQMQSCCNSDGSGWDLVCCGGGCFTGETEVSLEQEGERTGGQEGETKQIKELKPGDIVSSFDLETGEIKEGAVSDVTKTTREGYYILETEGGYKVKVTGEHPFLAIKTKNNQALNTKLQTTLNKLQEIFSHTLTYKLLTTLQARF